MTSLNDILSDAAYKFLQSHYKDGVMNLHKCGLTSFPIELLKFKDMKKLDLSKNKITSIPPEIEQLVNLKGTFYCYNNVIKDSVKPFTQKDSEEYSSKWMNLYKEKFETYLRQEANRGNDTAVYNLTECLTDEKLKNLNILLKQEYPDLIINVYPLYIEVKWE